MAIEGMFYVYAKVADLERAKQFYGDTLGWKLHTDEPQVAGFWFGSAYLVAGLDSGAASGPPRAEGMHIAARVSDIEAEHVRLAERGVEVSPIQRRPWGERNFSFEDPDGYLWELDSRCDGAPLLLPRRR
jgi:catechol 2,3-dioxygenase-like lactoylglutathione lyase family enzyme